MYLIEHNGKYAVVQNNGNQIFLYLRGELVQWVNSLTDILLSRYAYNTRDKEPKGQKVHIPYFHSTFKGLKWDIRDYFNLGRVTIVSPNILDIRDILRDHVREAQANLSGDTIHCNMFEGLLDILEPFEITKLTLPKGANDE